jgi:Nif-specific regulatory protein
MNPRLIALAGPLEGTSFALAEQEVSIGRGQSNQLWVNDALASRRHALIQREGDSFKLVDLESSNGTRVNGVPIKSRALEHGDLIEIGDSLFLFLLHEETELQPPASPVVIDEEDSGAQATIQLRLKDALYLHPEKMLSALPPAARMARDLSTLLKISNAINSINNLEELQKRLLESIFEAIPAQRGAILLTEEGSKDFISVVTDSRLKGSSQQVQVSRTIINQVLQDGTAILSSDVTGRQYLSEAPSLISSRVHSLLCVPLVIFDKVLGALYVDTTDRSVQFTENDLQMLTAIASVAAVTLENIRYLERLKQENQRLQAAIDIEHNIIGESSPMRELYQYIARVAPTDSSVLIRGENGTGKELVARAIHSKSQRADGPFVAINCAALTESLLESELFGHERGAFTGAIAQKKGKLEVAQGGTVFLDEVGELALPLQAKLLRVLQEREFERVGGTRTIKLDIRLIAATNRDIQAAMQEGSFRKDLFHRLNVILIQVPPLRERSEDIPLLSNYFVTKHSQKCKRRIRGISAEALSYLMSYDWPGNVRELENAIERAVVLGSTDKILPEDLPGDIIETSVGTRRPADGHTTKLHEAVREAKVQTILRALDQAGGSYVEAAKLLGIHVNNLHRYIRDLGLKPLLK